MWKHKKCKCKICEENGGSTTIFRSMSEGKVHLYAAHHIPFSRAKENLIPVTIQPKIITFD